MKIFIMTDMECVSGLTSNVYLDMSSPRYEITRQNLTKDINAAVEGSFKAGADEVEVRDGHGVPSNIPD